MIAKKPSFSKVVGSLLRFGNCYEGKGFTNRYADASWSLSLMGFSSPIPTLPLNFQDNSVDCYAPIAGYIAKRA